MGKTKGKLHAKLLRCVVATRYDIAMHCEIKGVKGLGGKSVHQARNAEFTVLLVAPNDL